MARSRIKRRSFSRRLIGSGELVASLDSEWTAEASDDAQICPKDSIKMTKLDTYVLKNSWVLIRFPQMPALQAGGKY